MSGLIEQVAADGSDPVYRFEGKVKLSIMITPHQCYLTVGSNDVYMSFTTDPAKALSFNYYRVTTADLPNVYVLQPVPFIATPAMWAGGYLTVVGQDDGVQAMALAEWRRATQFVCDRTENGMRFYARGSKRYVAARRWPDGMVRFWMPEIASAYGWSMQTVQAWNDQSMDGADLRYVTNLKLLCRGKNSYAGALLQRAELNDASIQYSNFKGAQCEGARFDNATMHNTDFTGATVKNASFNGAQAQNAIFPAVDFSGATFLPDSRPASLAGATLTGATFDNCPMTGADFKEAKLGGAKFRGATIEDADFSKADLIGAYLDNAKARRAKFVEAKLNRANLPKAELDGAKFTRAVLTHAGLAGATFGTFADPAQRTDFSGATLHEIDFSDCNLTQVTIARPAAFLENGTVVPGTEHRRALFHNATIPLAVLGTTNWRMLDLSGATIVDKLPKSLVGFVADYCIFPDSYDLTSSDISKANFRHARMVNIRLENAVAPVEQATDAPDFSSADLRRANLPHAILPFVKFIAASMHGINLSYAVLDAAKFTGAHLETIDDKESGTMVTLTSDLSHSRLFNASFEGAYLGRGVKSVGANLSFTTFYGEDAKLTNATLAGAQFNNAFLAGLDFTGNSDKSMEDVSFSGACLANCILSKASLLGANLTNACLLGANFSDAQLFGAQMGGANISFKPVTLTATRPDGKVREIDCIATVILPKATNGLTTCPIGDRGPCKDEMWIRKKGTVDVWPMKSELPASADG